MLSKVRMFVVVSLTIIFLAGMTQALAGPGAKSPFSDLNLSKEQVDALEKLVDEFNEKEFKIISDIETKFNELELELKREDRFETELKGKRSAQRANKLVRDVSALYGQLLKTRVEYLLKAKNVLTKEQKEQLISSLEFEIELPEDLSYYQEFDLLDLGLDLTRSQIRKILRYRTDMMVKELQIELEMEYKILDLEIELAQDEVNPQKIDQIITGVTDLGTKIIDNRVDHFLKSKDVLTVAQRKALLHLILMTM